MTFVTLAAERRPAPPVGVHGGKKVPAPADAALHLDALPPSIRDRLADAIGRPHLQPMREPAASKKLQPAGPLGPWVAASRSQRAKEVEAERRRAVAALQTKRKPAQALHKAFIDKGLRAVDSKETKS